MQRLSNRDPEADTLVFALLCLVLQSADDVRRHTAKILVVYHCTCQSWSTPEGTKHAPHTILKAAPRLAVSNLLVAGNSLGATCMAFTGACPIRAEKKQGGAKQGLSSTHTHGSCAQANARFLSFTREPSFRSLYSLWVPAMTISANSLFMGRLSYPNALGGLPSGIL